MPLASISVPNLVTGVSQQPSALRLPTACGEMINGWPSYVSGLNKRAPTEWIKRLGDASILKGNDACYLLDRGETYRYLVLASRDRIRVFDLDGKEQVVNAPNGYSYLTQTTNPREQFKFVTLGDTTFVLNSNVIVGADEYGEVGTHNTNYDGEVATKDVLPNPSGIAEGAMYYVTGESTFYRRITVPATPARYGWKLVQDWTEAQPTDARGLYVLPEQGNGPGDRVAIVRPYNKPITDPLMVMFFKRTFVLVYQWQTYEWVVTENAKPSYTTWQKVDSKELVKTVHGRMDPSRMATVHITQSVPLSNYSIYFDGVLQANYVSGANIDAATALLGTDSIAALLATALQGKGWEVQRFGSTIMILNLDPDVDVRVMASGGDKAMKCYRGVVDQFANLPPNEIFGRIVKVQGDLKDNGDDYYVLHNKNGVWEETWGWNAGAGPINGTMPHVLVREADGTWTFKVWKWQGRVVGDENSNPHPSFVGTNIRDMVIYSNRLCFIADENVIMSEANNYENFYRTTVATYVDSDPIDIAALNSGSDILYHAVPFNKDLLLMSDKNQFRLSYQNYLGPKNIQLQYTTSFNMSRTIHPINMGGSVYFVDDKPTYMFTKVWEYFPRQDNSGDDAEDVTAAIPEYIKADIGFMAANARLKLLILYSDREPSTLYLYKYLWGDEKKIQSAWGKWTFNDCKRIVWAGFSDNYLYLLMERSDGVHLERIRCDEKVSRIELNSRLLLDKATQKERIPDIQYDELNNLSTVTLPWTTTENVELVASWVTDDPETTVTDWRSNVEVLAPNKIRVQNDLRNATYVTIGIPYNFIYEFTTPYIRQQKGGGEVVVLDGLRLQMRYITIEYMDTAYFMTRLKYPDREDVVTTFDGKITASAEYKVGATPYSNGKYRIAIAGSNKNMMFRLENESPFNSSFGSAEWTCTYVPRAGMRV